MEACGFLTFVVVLEYDAKVNVFWGLSFFAFIVCWWIGPMIPVADQDIRCSNLLLGDDDFDMLWI